MNRRDAAIALLALGVAPIVATAQPAPGIHKIGFLALRSRSTPANPDRLFDAFVQGMRDLGYVEGKNLVIEWRFADNKADLLPGLAAELTKAGVEVIVTHYTPAAQILQKLTKTIPIVCTACGDPIGSGLAASLARPGGNFTGMSIMSMDLASKQLELLREIVPGLARVGVLVNPSNPLINDAYVKSIQAAAQRSGTTIVPVSARAIGEFEGAFASLNREQVKAVILSTDALFTGQLKRIATLAANSRIASMYAYEQHSEAGGLISYGLDILDSHRRAAAYADRIFKGAKAGELPIEQPTRICLAVNLKTAKSLGIAVPQSILARADRVIE